MPFFKNAKDEICQVYETEVKPVLEAGWKELTAVEESEYRAMLHGKEELTSAVAIEAARVKAGLHELFGQVKTTVAADAQKVETAVKTATKKPVAKSPAAKNPAANSTDTTVKTDPVAGTDATAGANATEGAK